MLESPKRQRSPSGNVGRAVALAALHLGWSIAGNAQLPGLPVLQNGFVGPGLAAAVNGGGGSGSAFAAALSWAPRSARFQVSLGAGALRSEGATGGAFGARVAFAVLSRANGRFGVAAFGGLGGAQGPRIQPDGRVGLGQAPLGAALGYRRAIGATRGVSFYVAPFFGFFRSDDGNVTQSKGLFRVSIGGDVALTRALGITAGVEAGQNAGNGKPGPTAALWGVGVSYAFGRR
jgi:hypothetical protein